MTKSNKRKKAAQAQHASSAATATSSVATSAHPSPQIRKIAHSCMPNASAAVSAWARHENAVFKTVGDSTGFVIDEDSLPRFQLPCIRGLDPGCFQINAHGGVLDVLDDVVGVAATPNAYGWIKDEGHEGVTVRALRTMLAVAGMEKEESRLEEPDGEEEVIRMMNEQNDRLHFVTFEVWHGNALQTFGIAGIYGDETSGKTIRLMVAIDTD